MIPPEHLRSTKMSPLEKMLENALNKKQSLFQVINHPEITSETKQHNPVFVCGVEDGDFYEESDSNN
jgi:hypothetical protein